jgi:hypothetical protein
MLFQLLLSEPVSEVGELQESSLKLGNDEVDDFDSSGRAGFRTGFSAMAACQAVSLQWITAFA